MSASSGYKPLRPAPPGHRRVLGIELVAHRIGAIELRQGRGATP